jgi:hypothetical protein
MDNQNGTNTSVDWEEVILSLQSFTRSWVNGKGWFRGGKTTTFLQGKEIEDYVFGAIEKYLRNPEKHNPSKGSLIDYIKYNLIRSLVRNDLVSAENQTSRDVFASADKYEEDDVVGSYLDSILPFATAYFDQEIDFAEIMLEIDQEISKDKIAEEIYLCERCYGMKRADIIAEFNMLEKVFDNGKRRMQTILNNIAKKYDLNKLSV